MDTSPSTVLHWELYGGGTAITFVAERRDGGYALTLRRDDALVMTTVTRDVDSVFLKSADLRGALQDLGYAPPSGGRPASQLGGGVCWGPAPIDAAVVSLIANP